MFEQKNMNITFYAIKDSVLLSSFYYYILNHNSRFICEIYSNGSFHHFFKLSRLKTGLDEKSFGMPLMFSQVNPSLGLTMN